MITIERTLDEMKRAAEARGMEKGQAKGKLEGKVEVARIALKKGFSINDVAEITGLSMETVLELKKELEN